MHVVQLHGILAARPRANRPVLPFKVTLRVAGASVDPWPAAATAAVLLAGGSPALDSPAEQLDELIAHAVTLADIGVIDAEQFEATMHEVIDEVIEWASAAQSN
ncbi:MAG: hypothetical protein JNM18_25175 [Planctomycetaceae bacterium]|nr:hypothetical protein [Planctomycetaceae bacterium]